jgi:tRNA threonylcarbamoyladenosine biosynthesis protein TsaE
MDNWQVESDSPEETQNLGALLGKFAETGTVVLLKGDLGAGKTCFAQGVARGLGVPESHPVTSPTFVIMNQYPARLTLYHFDLYRLSGHDDFETIGAEDVLGRDGLCLVEWPERVDLDLPSLEVSLEDVGEDRRQLKISSSDPFHGELLSLWSEAWSS